MTLGDGIRRNIAKVSIHERDLFMDAIKQLNHIYYSPNGSRSDFPAGHVSYWFKQDEIHQSSHVHECPQFLPWHRELCNRFEVLLRSIHPELSLHYWDWNFDPSNMPDGQGNFVNLFNSEFMGNADVHINGGSVGEPLLSAGFYLLNPTDPDPTDGRFRNNISPVRIIKPDPTDPSTWHYPDKANPADPPKTLTRDKLPGPPPIGITLKDPFDINTPDGNPDWSPVPFGSPFPAVYWPTDEEFINANTWEQFNALMQGYPNNAGNAHGLAHSYIGGINGNLADPHISFRDPFVFLLHSNVDRLWSMWQRRNESIRLDPTQLYGSQENSRGSGDVDNGEPSWGILSPVEPWSGFTAQTPATGIITSLVPIRPWYIPENEQNLPGNNKTAKDLSIVTPPRYDTP